MKLVALIIATALIAALATYMVFLKTNPLQERAKEFLNLPIPEGMSYAPDSISERLIVEYANNGKVNLDPELMELLQIVVMESPIVENAQPGSEDAYMNESALILREILDEAHR